MQRRILFIALMSLFAISPLLLGFAAPAAAIDLRPFAFVGKAGDCGTGYPAGARIVTAGWVNGIGLPDNGGDSNPVGLDPADLNNKTNVRDGLFLQKNGPTPVCSSAGATVGNLNGAITVGAPTNFEFDYRTALHCGAGAPRFNITYDLAPGFSFAGCSAGTHTPSTLEAGWTHVVIDVTAVGQAFPPVPIGAKITAISIVFDEGTDAGPDFTGYAIIDNVQFDGKAPIRMGTGIAD